MRPAAGPPRMRRRPREPGRARGPARLPARPPALRAVGHDHRVLAVRRRAVRARGREPAARADPRGGARGGRGLRAPRHPDRGERPGLEGHRGVSGSAVRHVRVRGGRPRPGPGRAGRVSGRVPRAGAQSPARLDRGETETRVPHRRPRERGGGAPARLRVRGGRALRPGLGGEARPAAPDRGGGRVGRRRRLRGRRHHHHRHHDPHGRAAAQPGDRHHAPGRRHRRLHPPPLPAAGGDERDAGRVDRRGLVLRRLRADHQVPAPGRVLLAGAGARHRGLRDGDRLLGQRVERGEALTTSVKRPTSASNESVKPQRKPVHALVRRLCWTVLFDVFALSSLITAQQRPTFDQQMRDNQRRLETIRQERSAVEAELARLRTAAHSLSDELSNLERQKQTTTRIVNELDRQINEISGQVDQTTTDLLLAQGALQEKRAVLARRLVDIYKRGPLYSYQVLLAAESFGDLLSRYKYLYLVSRQDRKLADDMDRLRRKIDRERRVLVEARDALGRRRGERTDELQRFVTLERDRRENLRATQRGAQQAERRLSQLERNERDLNDRIEALERARREAEARGAPAGPASITTADLGRLAWPVEGRLLYRFGVEQGPNNTRIPRHGIGIAAPVGAAVRAVAAGTVKLVGPLGLYLTSVLVDHGGGYYSFYAYLDDATVAKDDRVVAGQVIGHVGGENSDEGAHLHFEIRGQGGIALDPINWLRTRR